MAVEYLLFQSTLPRGERQYFYQQNHLPPKFQSALPRGERPDRLNGQCIIRFISIHAPARGATLLPSLSFLRQFISIHAPARGATSCYQALVDRIGNFNPRSREGSDALKQSAFCIIIISIHAPARGATSSPCYAITIIDISIHAPARGATQSGLDTFSTISNFNPRSREGSDRQSPSAH